MEIADISRTISKLSAKGVRVVLIGQSPIFGFSYPDEYFYGQFGAVPRSQSDAFYYSKSDVSPTLNQELAKAAGQDVFFDPSGILCRQNLCIYKERDTYLFVDYGHLTTFGSQKLTRALLNQANLMTEK